MEYFFMILGVITFIASFVSGFGFIFGLITGVFSSSIFFGIGIIIYKLKDIEDRLIYSNQTTKIIKNSITDKKVCQHCKKVVDRDYDSCPYCARMIFTEYK